MHFKWNNILSLFFCHFNFACVNLRIIKWGNKIQSLFWKSFVILSYNDNELWWQQYCFNKLVVLSAVKLLASFLFGQIVLHILICRAWSLVRRATHSIKVSFISLGRAPLFERKTRQIGCSSGKKIYQNVNWSLKSVSASDRDFK